MKRKKETPIFWDGTTKNHSRYFMIEQGTYEMITGWSGGGNMDEWKCMVRVVGDDLRVLENCDIAIATRKEIVTKINEYERNKQINENYKNKSLSKKI